MNSTTRAGPGIGPAEITGHQIAATTDTVDVEGPVFVSPFSMYRYDASYATEVLAAHPSRVRVVKSVDPTDTIAA